MHFPGLPGYQVGLFGLILGVGYCLAAFFDTTLYLRERWNFDLKTLSLTLTSAMIINCTGYNNMSWFRYYYIVYIYFPSSRVGDLKIFTRNQSLLSIWMNCVSMSPRKVLDPSCCSTDQGSISNISVTLPLWFHYKSYCLLELLYSLQ